MIRDLWSNERTSETAINIFLKFCIIRYTHLAKLCKIIWYLPLWDQSNNIIGNVNWRLGTTSLTSTTVFIYGIFVSFRLLCVHDDKLNLQRKMNIGWNIKSTTDCRCLRRDSRTWCILGTSCCITSDFKRLRIKGPKMDFMREISLWSSAFSSFFRSTSPVANMSGIMNSNNDHSSCRPYYQIKFQIYSNLRSNRILSNKIASKKMWWWKAFR